jgi:hypothetical protein
MASAGRGYLVSGNLLRRLGETVKAHEQAPARDRPASPFGAVIAPSRVCVVEIVSGPDVDGTYEVKIKKREPDGTYVDVSSVTFTMEDLNA